MIRKIFSDHANFKTIEFNPGFNLVLAERTKTSTKKDSRNGLGKTTLLEIIHFCLGAKATKGRGLLREPLIGWTFGLVIDLLGSKYIVRRGTDAPQRIFVEGNFHGWPLPPKRDSRTQETFYSINEWNEILGWAIFGLDIAKEETKYLPTFRSLISYFARLGRDAFSTPFEHHRKQREWDKQVNNAFLLNLGWQHAQRLQLLKDQCKTIEEL